MTLKHGNGGRLNHYRSHMEYNRFSLFGSPGSFISRCPSQKGIVALAGRDWTRKSKQQAGRPRHVATLNDLASDGLAGTKKVFSTWCFCLLVLLDLPGRLDPCKAGSSSANAEMGQEWQRGGIYLIRGSGWTVWSKTCMWLSFLFFSDCCAGRIYTLH